MKDKFILMNMDDTRSKKIAEVLSNKTCKKILDYLSDNSEASEKDLADALDAPINTVEYNLKKLLDSGLVVKAKNFFWSSKGKKIDMYKLARKHIVISPKSTKPNLTVLKTILPIIAVIILLNFVAIQFLLEQQAPVANQTLNKFNSLGELNDFLEENTISRSGRGIFEGKNILFKTTGVAEMAIASDSDAGASDFSETNIQVQGVDEADVIKNDGKYIYTLTDNQQRLVIVDAYPAENLEVLSEISFDNRVEEFFINEDKLIVFAREYVYSLDFGYREYGYSLEEHKMTCIQLGRRLNSFVKIYNIEDRTNPELKDTISISGNYLNSRMIDNFVYVINNQYIRDEIILPAISSDEKSKTIQADEIYYSDIKDTSFQYTIIVSINVKTGEFSEKVLLTGRANNIYVSQKNIYTTYTKQSQWYYPLEAIKEGGIKDEEQTVINKFSIDDEKIEFVAAAEVPGHILNQFSMDEFEGNFRIATTISGYSDNKDTSANNMYILNGDLDITGKIEDIAPGESIYSVRFMGKKGYMVTFRHVDPLFVIDLDPENPKVLGKLKIPGYSDYLHPYDENHLIGIGKEVDASIDANKVHTEGAVYYTAIQGVKLAIFDVSDIKNPVEKYKVVIGDRGTESLATQDHKAFLFDRQKELLVVPITLAELKEGQPKSAQGEFTFQGAFVFNLNLEDGFKLKGRVSHYDDDDDTFLKSGYRFYGEKNVRRSLYMDETLYTISDEMIKANELEDLSEINFVELNSQRRI